MTIEQKLEILKRALESGASIKMNFFSWDVNGKEGAVELADKFPEFEKDFDHNTGTYWIDLVSDDYDFKGTIFYGVEK